MSPSRQNPQPLHVLFATPECAPLAKTGGLGDVSSALPAALRAIGVDVRVLLPGPHADKRFVQLAAEADYDELLDHGIEVWNFRPSMLHAKVMTVDGCIANIGSANLNSRSMALDEEINVVVLDPALVKTLDEHFDDDLARSEEIEPGLWEDRSPTQRAYERLATPIRRFF